MATIVVHCQPGAKRTQCQGWHDGKPKIQLKAPPVDGAANKVLIAFLAELMGVSKSAVTIEAGTTGRIKRLQIQGITPEDLIRAFGVPPP